jgi:hypothetical protein
MDDHTLIARAIGRDLRERYANTLKEPLPAHLTDLVARLAVSSDYADEQQSHSESADLAGTNP